MPTDQILIVINFELQWQTRNETYIIQHYNMFVSNENIIFTFVFNNFFFIKLHYISKHLSNPRKGGGWMWAESVLHMSANPCV